MYFGDLSTEVKSMMALAALVIFFAGIAFGTTTVQDEETETSFYDLIMSSILMVREVVYIVVLLLFALVLKSAL